MSACDLAVYWLLDRVGAFRLRVPGFVADPARPSSDRGQRQTRAGDGCSNGFRFKRGGSSQGSVGGPGGLEGFWVLRDERFLKCERLESYGATDPDRRRRAERLWPRRRGDRGWGGRGRALMLGRASVLGWRARAADRVGCEAVVLCRTTELHARGDLSWDRASVLGAVSARAETVIQVQALGDYRLGRQT
jgi:hypothetical protein